MRTCCCEKRRKVKGAWSKAEDQKLIDYIGKHGEGRWRSLPQAAGLLRCGKSCRLRWVNYLKPDLKRGNFGEDEEDLIIRLHALLGNRWTLIAGRLPGRTDNEVKNYWNTHLSKRLQKSGVDMSKHNRMHRAHSSQNSRSQETKAPTLQVKNEDDDNECKSDSTSASITCGSSSTSVLPDLNLDLNVAVPVPVPVIEEKKKDKECMLLDPTYPIETKAFYNADSSPLLLLFR